MQSLAMVHLKSVVLLIGGFGSWALPRCPPSVFVNDSSVSCDRYCDGESMGGHAYAGGDMHCDGAPMREGKAHGSDCTCVCRYWAPKGVKTCEPGTVAQGLNGLAGHFWVCYYEVCSVITDNYNHSLSSVSSCSYERVPGHCNPDSRAATLCSVKSSVPATETTCKANFAGSNLSVVGDWSRATGLAYFHPSSCDERCAINRCNRDPGCKGYERFEKAISIDGIRHTDLVSLKNIVSGSLTGPGYACFRKICVGDTNSSSRSPDSSSSSGRTFHTSEYSTASTATPTRHPGLMFFFVAWSCLVGLPTHSLIIGA